MVFLYSVRIPVEFFFQIFLFIHFFQNSKILNTVLQITRSTKERNLRSCRKDNDKKKPNPYCNVAQKNNKKERQVKENAKKEGKHNLFLLAHLINNIPNPSLALFCQVKLLTKAEGKFILGADGNLYCYKQSKCRILEKLHHFMASYEGLEYLLQNNHKLF